MKKQIYDTCNLRKVILSFPNQFAEVFAIARKVNVNKNFSRVVVSGVGGSALPTDVLRCYLDEYYKKDSAYQFLPLVNNRTYQLPREAYDDCLNIICSHSGNTEETISSFNEAIKNNLPCIGISAGGMIEKMCKQNNIPHVKLPIPYDNFQPRMAVGHFVGAMLQILINAEKIADISLKIEKKMVAQLSEYSVNSEKIGKKYAKKLIGKTPVIYAEDRLRSLAMIWKIDFNENSKVPAFWNVFPEVNHNEYVGYTLPQTQFHILILRDKKDHVRNLLRYDVTARFLKKKGVTSDIVDLPQGDLLYTLFATIILGDWISYYLALAYEQDPTPVAMVEDLKKALL